jgi:hypothetical protein
MDKIYVARVFAYETPSESAKGKASVGMSVASRLNGNSDWVGTYNADRGYDGRKIGFITSPNKFDSVDDAKVAAEKLAKKYPRGKALDSKEWVWGEEITSPVEGTHEVLFMQEGVAYSQDADAVRQAAGATVASPAQ